MDSLKKNWIVVIDVQTHQNTTRVTFSKKLKNDDMPYSLRLSLLTFHIDLTRLTYGLKVKFMCTWNCLNDDFRAPTFTYTAGLWMDLGMTQSWFMRWLESNGFLLRSWVESNQNYQMLIESWVEWNKFLGEALESLVAFIHFTRNVV